MEAGHYARANRARPYVERALILFVGAMLLILDIGGFNRNTDYYSLNIWNVLVDPFYSVRHREEVTVVLLTDTDLRELAESYPPRAALHASVVNVLTRHKPRAVMIDLIFTQERDDPTFANLAEEIRAYKTATGTPVFLAAIVDHDGNRVPFRRDIEELVADGSAVPVTVARGHRDWLAQIYALRQEKPVQLDSGALALYRQYCDEMACKEVVGHGFDAPLYTVWSSAVAPFNVKHGCETQPSLLIRIWGVTFGRFPELACPYTPTLEVASLVTADPQHPSLVERLKDRIVIYGAGLSGASDIVTPPFHRALPGVFAHAMSTDNLLRWGARYYREELHGLEFIERLKAFEVVTLALVLFLPLRLVPALRARGWGRAVLALVALDPVPKRSGPLIWTPLFGLQRLGRRLLPGLTLTLAIIGFEVYVLSLVPLNWVGVVAIAVLGELAERKMGIVTNFALFVLYSPHRGRFATALLDRDAAGVVRAELSAIAAGDETAGHN
jgi:hypothetical protein